MLNDVMKHFNIVKEFRQAGYFETEQLKKLMDDIKFSIQKGKIIAISGIVGCGKTTALEYFQKALAKDKEVIVSKSLSIDKKRVTVPALTVALFLDLSIKKAGSSEIKIPTHPEKRIRKLQKIIRNKNKPVVLFIDEAHDLHSNTLKGLKRLFETVNMDGGCLSILLAGHPKLKNDLERPVFEEIGSRADVFTMEGIGSNKREYIEWIINRCTKAGVKIDSILTDEAIDLLADKLLTPLQVGHYLTRSLEEAYKIGVKPVTEDIANSVIARDINDIEPTLVRHGYNTRNLAEILNVKPSIIRSFIKGKLSSNQAQDIQEEMLLVGIPI
ncbi:MAG: AAA family ATPase [Desulfobacteraceae bacterium]|nr:AAA family ATPase [Desulfobacteraceae bacterium]